MEQIAWVVAVLRSRWDRKVIQRLDVTGSHQQLQAGRTKGGCRTTRAQARATQQKLDLPNRSRNDGGDRSERLADFPGAFFPPSLPVPSTGKTQAEGGLCRSRAGNREETGVQASRGTGAEWERRSVVVGKSDQKGPYRLGEGWKHGLSVKGSLGEF